MTTLALAPRLLGRDLSFGTSEFASTIAANASSALEHFFSAVTTEPVERQFAGLAETWRQERGFASSLSELVLCPSYQRIIGLGERVLPSLIREVSERPDHWFAALEAITGANPVKEQNRGVLSAMATDWVEWANQRGIEA